jgi:phosphatidylglycerol:prolipoprotein diacylglycerol transferase
VVQNNPSYYLNHPLETIAVWKGGMAYFGAIFGGALAVIISAWLFKLPIWSLMDIGALGLTIGQTIGRVGNIINGDIVGYPTNGWGFQYTNPHSFGPLNTPVQPASLYELLISLGLFILLWSLRKRIRPEGMLAMIYLILYSISQFLIFFVRQNDIVFLGLKQAQVTSIVVILLTIPVIIYLLRTRPGIASPEPAPVQAETQAPGTESQAPQAQSQAPQAESQALHEQPPGPPAEPAKPETA